MPMTASEIETAIRASLPDARGTSEGWAGDVDHYRAHIVSAQFRGKSRLQQHQLVYQALGDRMGGELHALALSTAIPPE